MDKLLQFDNVSFSYPGGIKALEEVTFSIDSGERIALVGLNGSGKSTLMLLAAGLVYADAGDVTLRGRRVDAKTARECRTSTGIVFQNADDQLFMPTVEADVAFGPRNMKLAESDVNARVDEALRLTGCEDLRHRQPTQLSGGQKKMVSLATVLSMNPELLILDEPTTGLDYVAAERFVEVISGLPHTILIATHDMALAKGLCSRALVMEHGRLVYDGPIESMPFPQ